MLIDGKWVEKSLITSNDQGSFSRVPRSFLDHPSQEMIKNNPKRFHLYISHACPWAHRTMIFRALKSLESLIDVSVVHPIIENQGWTFDQDFNGSTGDKLYGKARLYEIYQQASKHVTTTVTVPLLWDKETQTIINNESSQIIRIFNKSFNSITGNDKDYYPEQLRNQIDRWNELIYEPINNGVYKCGFAKSQQAYDSAVKPLFKTLSIIEDHLENHSFLVGDSLTEADIRLLVTLIRFDSVYAVHFKCSYKRIKDYPNLSRYLETCAYQIPEIASTTHQDHIVTHYYKSHPEINPHGIVPLVNM